MTQKTIIFDASVIFYRTYFANADKINDAPDFLLHSFLTSIIKQIKRHSPDEVILALDSHSWRKDYFKENFDFLQYGDDDYWKKYSLGYKGQRIKDSKIKKLDLLNILDDLYNNLNDFTNYKCIKMDLAEADDIISVLSKHIQNNIIIISSDKDFIQLLDRDNVNIFDPLKDHFVDKDNINIESFKVNHILIGDSIDNIPPVQKKLGPKTASKMIKEIHKFLSLDPIMKIRYQFNQNLIDLNFIPENLKTKIIERYNFLNNTNNYDMNGLLRFFARHNLREISSNLNFFNVKNNKNTLQNTITNKKTEQILEDSVVSLFN